MRQAVLFLLLISTFFKVNAQTERKENTFGITIGASNSNITNYGKKSLFGITGGIYWDWRFSNRFSLLSNFLYIKKGAKESGTIPELKLNYITMPSMLKFYGTDKLCFLAGLYYDVLLSVASDNLNKDDFKGSDWGVPIGVSYDILNNFQLGMTYNIGLAGISKNNSSTEKISSNFGHLTLTYLFK